MILIACLTFGLFKNAVIAQDVLKMAEDKDSKKDTKILNIQSIDGKNQKVRIVPYYVNHVLRMSCSNDTININDYWDVPPEIRVLNKNFIEIRYEVRGGSNLALGNMLVLCVNNNKLYEAMHVLRYISSETGNEHENYNIKAALNGANKGNYRLIVNIHDEVHSKSDPQTNYNYNNQTVLNFDASRNVFYSVKESIYHSFTSYYLKGKKYKQRIGGNFPVIILGTETYYSIKDKWYVSKRNNELNEFK